MNKPKKLQNTNVVLSAHIFIAAVFLLAGILELISLGSNTGDERLSFYGALLSLYLILPTLLIVVPITIILSLLQWREWRIILPSALCILLVSQFIKGGEVNLAVTWTITILYILTVMWFALNWYFQSKKS